MALDFAISSTAPPHAPEPQTLAFAPLPPPPPPPPMPPATRYLPLPLSGAAVLPPGPPVLVPGPVVVRVDHAFLMQMDARRTISLIQFLAKEGGQPSAEEETRRKQVIHELNLIVSDWAKKVAHQCKFPPHLVASASAMVLPFGSYALGVYGPESDIDALCVGPCFASLEHHFFVVLRQMLEDRPEVSELHSVESAKVPLMRFKFNGILIDFPYVQLPVITTFEAINIFDPLLPKKVDESSWRSLSGVRVNAQILQLVPNLKKFQAVLRCIKLWAKRRGLHSHLLGFFGGIHWAILAAYVCQRHAHGSVNFLFTIFFEIFSHWPWPLPVSLLDQSTQCPTADSRSLMPIMMPCLPTEFCNSNITRSTSNKIKEELQRGYALTRDLGRLDFEWNWLFEPFPYVMKYGQFLSIVLSAASADELRDWVGWVKSRFRTLILKLESLRVDCDPDPTEHVDHNVTKPNVAFYWGLMPRRGVPLSVRSVKEDFMRSIKNDLYGKERCCNSSLEMSIVGPSQLPKSMQVDRGPNGIDAFWGVVDPNMHRQPVYSQYLPHYWNAIG